MPRLLNIAVAALALGVPVATSAARPSAPIGSGTHTCRPAAAADCTGVNAPGANLRGKDLRGIRFINADLRGADLRNADLRRARLHGVNLTGANLQGANLNRSSLRGVALVNVRMNGATMRYARIGAPGRRSNARGDMQIAPPMPPMPTVPSGTGVATGCGLQNRSQTCTLNGVTLSGDYCGLPLDYSVIQNSTLTGSFGTTSASGDRPGCPVAVSFIGTVQNNNDWTGANLTGVNFSYSTINNSDFRSVQANGTYWHYTVGKYNDFTGAVYGTDNDFADVDMQYATCPNGYQGEFLNGPCINQL